MTPAEFRREMDQYWASVDREALEMKDSYLALDRLHSLYRRLDEADRALADEVLCEWVLSDTEAKRFDAMAMIRAFRVEHAVPALEQLSRRLENSDEPGAPFEQEKIGGLLSELTANGIGSGPE